MSGIHQLRTRPVIDTQRLLHNLLLRPRRTLGLASRRGRRAQDSVLRAAANGCRWAAVCGHLQPFEPCEVAGTGRSCLYPAGTERCGCGGPRVAMIEAQGAELAALKQQMAALIRGRAVTAMGGQ